MGGFTAMKCLSTCLLEALRIGYLTLLELHGALDKRLRLSNLYRPRTGHPARTLCAARKTYRTRGPSSARHRLPSYLVFPTSIKTTIKA